MIVVTGAAGRVGRAVVAQLTADGQNVLGVDLREGDGVAHQMAIGDPKALQPIVRGADAIVHVAGIPNTNAHPAHTVFASNTATTFAVLEAAVSERIRRVVVASSGSIMGISTAPTAESPLYAPFDETYPPMPRDPYALSKAVDEATCAMFHRAYGFSVAVLRFPTVGTGDAIAERVHRVRADPGAWRNSLWSYIELGDLARAFSAAVAAEDVSGEVICVAAADTTSDLPTQELFHRFHPSTEIRAPLPGTSSPWQTDKAKRLLGWESTYTWRQN